MYEVEEIHETIKGKRTLVGWGVFCAGKLVQGQVYRIDQVKYPKGKRNKAEAHRISHHLALTAAHDFEAGIE